MKLGFTTWYTEERVAFAGRAGFDGLEVWAELNSPLDLNKMDDGDIARTADWFAQNGTEVLTLQCAPPQLGRDPARRAANNAYFTRALKSAKKFGTSIVVTQLYIDRDAPPESVLPVYKEIFSRHAETAEREGVVIAVENCPHWGGYPKSIGNLGATPELWDAMFDAVPSKRIGLEFDPSHLCWMGVDYVKAIRTYGDRIFSFHAKDTEILEDRRDKYGIFGRHVGGDEIGWWRYRVPGWGELNWKGIFGALYDIGYDGPMLIEHEDPVFEGDRANEGLERGLRFLRQFTEGGSVR